MTKSKLLKSAGLKIMACSAIGALLCVGLCKLGFYLSRDIHDGAPPDLDIIGGIGFVLSLVGIFGGFIIAVLGEPAPQNPEDDR